MTRLSSRDQRAFMRTGTVRVETALTGRGCVWLTYLLLANSAAAQHGGASSAAIPPPQAQRPLADVEMPPRVFASAEEHYRYLLEQANGGTQHSSATIPIWDGLWTAGYTSMASLFLEEPLATAPPPIAKVREGVLTPAYEQHFRARRAEILEHGQPRYDRLMNCEYAGVPRWLSQPNIKEFVNAPTQTWMISEFMDETRRVYIGAEHVNVDAEHSPTGDSIGFWAGDTLVIWTKWVNPGDYMLGMPLTSNQFEMVESWEEKRSGEARQLVAQVTFYDPIGLTRPVSAVYTHDSRPDLEELGVRLKNWQCTKNNSFRDTAGNMQVRQPGDPAYQETPRFSDFPELPGQALSPMFDTTSEGNAR
jgi:hypothetical protein